MNIEELRKRYEQHGQDHVFRFWDELNDDQKEAFATQLASIDLDLVDRLYADATAKSEPPAAETLLPEPVVELPRTPDDRQRDQKAETTGTELLRGGRVAVITVAGGQGTRLGFDGPKGCYPIGPVTERTLFRIHAEKILALGKRYGKPLPWYLMTSEQNHEPTVRFFKEQNCFGISPDDVRFFTQRMLPAVDYDGKLLLADKDRLAMSPDGHGGTVRALKVSGALDDMQQRGVEVLFYFQVDNPMVSIADPVFLGHHRLGTSEMSSKVVRKTDPYEKVGVVCRVNDPEGPAKVIEYSELPQELAEARNEDGGLKYWAGSIAIHVIDVPLLQRLTAGVGQGTEGELHLPFHRANKKIAHVDEQGRAQKPSEPNGIKFETFIFDVLPLTQKTVTVECDRNEEFAPVKQPTGVDSVESCRRAMTEQYARWMEAAGGSIPRVDDGNVNGVIELSPLVALDAADVKALKDQDGLPELPAGGTLVLE